MPHEEVGSAYSSRSHQTIVRVIRSTNDEVRQLLCDLNVCLKALSLTAEEVGTIEIVLAEALNNIVEHAYRDKEGSISIRLTPAKNGLMVRLEDHGSPLPNGEMPLGRTFVAGTAFEDLPEGGFGWFLIREIARDLTYERVDNKNLLTFRFAVGVAVPVE